MARQPRSSRTGRSRRLILAPIAAMSVVWAWVAPVAALSPDVQLTLTVSPSPAVDGTDVTWTGVVSPINGVPTNIQFGMSGTWFMVSVGSSFVVAGGTCEPVANCTIDARTGNPTWIFASLDAPTTLRYHTLANSGHLTTLSVQTPEYCSGTCQAQASIKVPSVAAKVAYIPDSTPITTGTTLHVTVTGTATAGPMDADLQAKFSAGLAPPTAINPPAAVFSPAPYNYLDYRVTLHNKAALTFDTVVTASPGSTIALTGTVYPTDSKYGIGQQVVNIAVGAAQSPTPTPSPPAPGKTAAPTPTRPPAPTPSPNPTVAPSPSRISSTASPGQTDPADTASPVVPTETPSAPPSPGASAGRPTDSATGAVDPASETGAPTSPTGNTGPIPVNAPSPGIAVLIFGGVGGTALLLRWQRRRGT